MDEIYKEYARIVYRYLYSHTRDALLAEELTQETFFQAIRSIDRYDGSAKLSTWLCAMNADESPIGSGEILWFDLEASEVSFSGDTSLEFIIHTTDGKKHRVEERIKFPGASGTLHPLILSGSAEDGFHIAQE